MHISPKYSIEDDDPGLLGQFTAWMAEVVKNATIDYCRRQGYRNMECSLEDAPQDVFAYEDPVPASKKEFEFAESRLTEAFNGLNQLRRQILTLIFVKGLSAQETADRVNCSVDYVYLQKHRAIKTLRDQLMEGGGWCGD